MRRLALPRLTFVAAATRLALVVATLLFASDLVAQSAPTLDATDTVRITRRFFGLRYVAGTLPERPVIEPWLGLSLHQSFRDVLGRHPEALEQAQRASTGLLLSFAGILGVAVGFYMISSDALGQVDDFSSGKGSSRDGSRGVTVVLGSLGLSVVGSLITRGHIDRSIATFNALQRQSAPDHGAVARHQPAASVVRSFAQPTWTANHGAGLRLGVAVIAR